MSAGKETGVQLPLGLRLGKGNTFADYLPGPNEEAVAHLRHPLPGGTVAYLWGVPSTGKTHLLQAACHEAAEGGLRCAYLPLREWRSLQPDLLEGLEVLDLVCLDDVEAVAGQARWEAALFPLYNRLRDRDGRLLATGPRPPPALALALPDLRTRLAWGVVFQLRPLNDAQKLTGLRLRARSRGLELPVAVARYLLHRCPRDPGSLFRLLDRLDEASLAAQRRLTIPFVKEVLEAGARRGGA